MRPAPGPTRLADAAAGLLCPPRCLACRRLTGPGTDLGICPRCRADLAEDAVPEAVALVDRLVAVTPYRGPAVGLVAALKSGAVPAVAATVAELCAERLGPLDPATVLVPAPAGRLRALLRGVDPAAALAEALAARLGLAVEPVLARRDWGRQRGRPRSRRLAEPPRVAAVARAPGRALIVDDVTTTGATLEACARALRAGGARRVEAIALAATPRRRTGADRGWSPPG